MPTTVKYNGNTIATVADNQSVTLQTKGTWCNYDIVVTDAFTDLEAGFFNDTLSVIENSTATILGHYALGWRSALTSVTFTNVSIIGQYAFQSCSNLQTVSFPNAQTFSMGAFSYCGKLQTASFPKASNIYQYAFYYCSKLESIYFMGSSVPTLIASTVFNNTPITVSTYLGRWGSIYVPTSLAATYKAANFWSAVSARIVGI